MCDQHELRVLLLVRLQGSDKLCCSSAAALLAAAQLSRRHMHSKSEDGGVWWHHPAPAIHPAGVLPSSSVADCIKQHN